MAGAQSGRREDAGSGERLLARARPKGALGGHDVRVAVQEDGREGGVRPLPGHQDHGLPLLVNEGLRWEAGRESVEDACRGVCVGWSTAAAAYEEQLLKQNTEHYFIKTQCISGMSQWLAVKELPASEWRGAVLKGLLLRNVTPRSEATLNVKCHNIHTTV